MPNRNPTAAPTVIIGSVLESGTPNTGQVLYTLGGSKMYHVKSGVAGGATAIHVGAGRLDKIVMHPPATAAVGPAASGLALYFYDSAIAVSGGPLNASGHNTVAALSPVDPALVNFPNFESGVGLQGRILDLGIPFTSGLCVTTRSGQAGFTITYTPVVSG